MSFVVMGSNGKKFYAAGNSNTEMQNGIPNNGACNLFSRIERKWKVVRTNMTEDFNIDLKLSPFALENGFNVNDLRFIIDKDNNLSDGWEHCLKSGASPNFSITYNINDGTVSIRGINTSQIPNNSVRYITIGSVNAGTPRPVGLIDFTASCKTKKVELDWTTATETNNDYFTIEKSIDGERFEVIAKIDGQGTKTTDSEYSFTDYGSYVGISYYRISQTDFDGKETMLKTISSNCSSNEEISFHPNPTKDGVYVTFNAEKNKTIEIRVSDLLGKTISTHEINSSSWIPLPSVSGIYLLKYNINSSTKVEKIIKQ